MADLGGSRTNFRGILVPSPEAVFDPSASTVTQAGPLPGSAIAQQDSELGLDPSGAQAAGSSIEIRAGRPGTPTGEDSGLGLLWRNTGDDDWRGHDEPSTIAAWEAAMTVPAAATNQPEHPVPLTLANHTVLVAYGNADSSASEESVRVIARDPDDGTWGSPVEIYNHGSLYASGISARPCLVALPSGRVLAFYWVPDSASDALKIYMSYSDDDGATWTLGSKDCNPVFMEVASAGSGTSGYDEPHRMRAAYHESGIILMVSARLADINLGGTASREQIWQMASQNYGVSFQVVASADVTDPTSPGNGDYRGALPDVVVSRGVIVVAWTNWEPDVSDAGPGYAKVARLGSVNQPYTSEEAIDASLSGTVTSSDWVAASGSGTQFAGGDLTLIAADNGAVYLITRDANSDDDCGTARSLDTGQTWEALGRSGVGDHGTWCEVDTAGNAYIRRLAGCWVQGRALVVHQSTAASATVGASIGAAYLGGWSTVTRPPAVAIVGYDTTYRTTLSGCWIPIELPGNTSHWTSTGTGTETLTGAQLTLSTSATQIWYTANPSGTVARGAICEAEFAHVSGSAATRNIMLTWRVADSADEYQVNCRIGDSALTFYDAHGSSGAGTLFATVNINAQAGVVVYGHLKDGRFHAVVRARGTGSDREWTASATTTSLINANTYTTAASSNMIRWGHTIGTAESRWYRVSWDEDEYVGTGLLGQSNPVDLYARHVTGAPVYIDQGLYVAARDGSAYLADEWLIETRYAYGIERIDPREHASPRKEWRGLTPDSGTPPAEIITWALHESITSESALDTPLLGIALFGSNARTGAIHGQLSGGTYDPLLTWDAAKGMAVMAFTRKGATLVPASGGTDHPHLFTGECQGWIVEMTPSGGGTHVWRYLSGNGGGGWDVAGAVRPVLHMSDADGTEPSSGTLALYPPNFALLVQIGTSTYRRLRLTLDSQDTPDGYLKAGTILCGAVHVLGMDHSWGRVVETEARVSRDVRRDGIDRVHRNGPPGRTLRFGWVDGVDLTRAMGGAPTPDVVTTTTSGGASPVATVQSIPYDLDGIMRRANGALTPIGFLDDIQKLDDQVVNRHHRLMLGRVVSPVRLENRQGLPGYDEVVNIATTVIEEIT